MSFGKTREEAEEIERANLGYWAGYYRPETRERVERLFRCAHPFFGSIAEKGPPTPEQPTRLCTARPGAGITPARGFGERAPAPYPCV